MDIKKVSDRIKKARKKVGTIDRTASCMGISRNTLHKWENGIIKELDILKLEKLADLAGVSLSWILGEDPTEYSIAGDMAVKSYIHLSSDAIQALADLPPLLDARKGISSALSLWLTLPGFKEYMKQLDTLRGLFREKQEGCKNDDIISYQEYLVHRASEDLIRQFEKKASKEASQDIAREKEAEQRLFNDSFVASEEVEEEDPEEQTAADRLKEVFEELMNTLNNNALMVTDEKTKL